jgi:hypothetical protein
MTRSFFVAIAAAVIATPSVAGSSDWVLHNTLRRIKLSNGDYMLTISPSENPSGSTDDGPIFYVPVYSSTNYTLNYPIKRLFRFSDHMDSLVDGEGGYAFEANLGFPYLQQWQGTELIRRWFRASSGDHLTAKGSESYSGAGYTLDASLGYGYPRPNKQCNVGLSVTNGGSGSTLVQASANLAAGGVISALSWNGKQFVNNYDYGRQIQAAFSFSTDPTNNNPTEGGSMFGCAQGTYANPATNGLPQGSPVLASSVTGSTLTTTTQPLNWLPAYGGSSTQPSAWTGTMQKSVEFNSGGNWNRIKWVTTLNSPASLSGYDGELVGAYLNSEFNVFQKYLGAGSFSTISNSSFPTTGQLRCIEIIPSGSENPKGMVLATANGSYALGMYRSKQVGWNNHFGACYYPDPSNPQGSSDQYSQATSKILVLNRFEQRDAYGSQTLPAGSTSATAYLVIGTLAQVQAGLRQLEQEGK